MCAAIRLWCCLEFFGVALQDFTSEGNEVRDSTARRLPRRPELQIFDAVIVFDTVLVVDRLVRVEQPPKMLLHNQTMNELSLPIPIHIPTNVTFGVAVIGSRSDLFFRSAVTLESLPMDVTHPVARNLTLTAFDTTRRSPALSELIEGFVRGTVLLEPPPVLCAKFMAGYPPAAPWYSTNTPRAFRHRQSFRHSLAAAVIVRQSIPCSLAVRAERFPPASSRGHRRQL